MYTKFLVMQFYFIIFIYVTLGIDDGFQGTVNSVWQEIIGWRIGDAFSIHELDGVSGLYYGKLDREQ